MLPDSQDLTDGGQGLQLESRRPPKFTRQQSFATYKNVVEMRNAIDNIEPVVLGCLSKDNAFRKNAIKLYVSPWTKRFIGLVVLLLAGALCSYDPSEISVTRNVTIRWISLATTCVFALEMLVKVVSLGAWGPRGYFSDPWNWLDAILVSGMPL